MRGLARLLGALAAACVPALARASAPEAPVPAVVRVDGLSTAETFAQTPDGWVWLGGPAGLHRSDGRAATPVPGPWGLHAVRELHADRAGTLWVVSGRANLHRGEGTWVDFGSQPQRLWCGRPRATGGFDWQPVPAGQPWTATLDQDGRLLFSVGAEVFRVAAASLRPERVATAPSEVLALRFDADGALLVAGAFGVERHEPGGRVTPLLDEPVVRLLGGPGAGLALTERALVGLATGQRIGRAALGLHRVHDGGDRLVVAARGGVALLPHPFTPPPDQDGAGAPGPQPVPALHGMQLLAAFRDREGTLWIGTLGTGVFRSVPALTEAPALGEGYVVPFSVLVDRAGELVVTSTMGLHRLGRDGRLHTTPARELGVYTPRGMAELPDGTLVIAGDGHGIVLVRGPAREVVAPPRLRDGTRTAVSGVFTLPDGGLAVTLASGGVQLIAPGTRALRAAIEEAPVLDAADGLCAGEPAMLAADRDGGLHVAQSTGGVSYRAPGSARWRCIGPADGLPSGDATALLADPDGGVWVGFADAVGLAHLDGPRVRHVPPESGLGPAHVYGIALDARDRLWLTGDQGVRVLRRADLLAVRDGVRSRLATLRLGLSDGLPSENCLARFAPTIASLPDGRMAVPTLSGLVLLRGDPPVRPRPLTTVIEALRVRGRDRPLAHELTLRDDDAPIELSITAPTSIRPEGLRFEYTLGGSPERWSVLDRGRVLHLAGLEPGLHRIAVRALDELGQPASAPATLALRRLPPWWRHPLALAGAALALVGLGMGALQLRLYRFELQARAVGRERQRLARELHDGLAQGYTAIGMHLDVLARKAGKEAPHLVPLLEQTQKIVAQCSTLARNAIWNLRTLGANLSLASAIDAAIHRMEAPGVAISLVTRGRPGPVRTEALYELPLIAQEAVVNALRHGGGPRVTVTLEETPRELRLTVEDDGRGFRPEDVAPGEAGHGFGLTGMRERAARLGGVLTLDSAPGRGTRVEVRCPRDGRGGAGASAARETA